MAVLAQSFWVGRMLRCGECGCLALVLKGAEPVSVVEGEGGVETAFFACPMCAQPVAIDGETPRHPVTFYQDLPLTDGKPGGATAALSDARGFATHSGPFRVSWDT